MIKGFCLCRKKSVFREKIIYHNEITFKDYEGCIIGRCVYCKLLKTFYPEKGNKFNPLITKTEDYEKRKILFRSLLNPIVMMIARHMRRGKVADVGCSSGILLSLLREKGYDAYGIEPNKTAYALAKKQHKNNLFSGTFQKFQKNSKKKFDCIIYNHVLEHVADINEELNLIKKSLRKNGFLVVGIPNTRNSIFWLRGKYWESLLPLEHIWHFSDRRMENLLKKNGFSILERRYDDGVREQYPFLKRLYFRLLHMINRMFHTGEAVLFMARKKE